MMRAWRFPLVGKGAGVRDTKCELLLSPSIAAPMRQSRIAGEWLKDVDEATVRFRAWLIDMAAKFPLGSASQHFFGARSHGNEYDAW